MTEYLVIALYEDNLQRYATTVDAETADQAERLAQAQAVDDNEFDEDDEPLLIAAVLLDGEVVA